MTHPSILPPDTTQAGGPNQKRCSCGEPANPKSRLGLCGECLVKRRKERDVQKIAMYRRVRKGPIQELPCPCGCGRTVKSGGKRKYFSDECATAVHSRRYVKKRKSRPPTPAERAASQPEPQAQAPYRLPGLRDSGDEDCPERAKAVAAILARVGRGR